MSKSAWLLTAACLALTAPAMAQDASAPPEPVAEPEIGADIVVTATRRSEALSDVPLAISAVTAESLQNSGASDIRQLNQLAPSLLVSSTGNEANGSARIRGIGTVGDNPGLESSVAVFIDGVYRSRTGAGLNELGEIERVEVLRGPQGTLFGRNASAGLLNIISKSPSFEFGGYGEATYGNYDFIRVAGGVTGPVTETLALRLDGVYVERDGFYRDLTAGGRVNDRDRYFIRGQALYEPNDDISVRIIGDYTKRDEACCAAAYISTAETRDPTPGQPGDFATNSSNRIVNILRSLGGVFPDPGNPFSRNIASTPGRSYRNETEDYGISGQLDWDFGGVNLTSITAYRQYKAGGAGDIDYGNVDIFYRADDGNNFRQFKTFSQELRLQGSLFEDKLDWLVGAYYANEKLKVVDNSRFGSQYGAFAACRAVAGTAAVDTTAALRDPTRPGCLSPTLRSVLSNPASSPFGAGAPLIVAALDRLSTVNDVGDVRSVYNQDAENYAFFTHNIFNVTDRLAVTLGARYTKETKDLDADFNNNNAICPAQQAALAPLLSPTNPLFATAAGIVTLTCTGNSSTLLNTLDIRGGRSEDEWTGTANVSFKATDQLLAYASYSKGYKAGGFNLDRSDLGSAVFPRSNANAANLQFDPEKVDAYEIGFKYNGRQFNLNVAAFRQEFQNFQLNTFNGTVFIVQNINSCSTSLNGADRDNSGVTGTCAPGDVRAGVISQGVELESSVYPTRDIAFTAGYTYADTKYRNNLVGSARGEALDPFLFLLPGQNLSNAPKHVVTTSFAYTPDLGSSGLSGLIYVDSRLTSDYNTGSDLFPEKELDGFVLVNARIGLRGPEQRWAIELWAQNLLDHDYQQVAFNSPFQGAGSVAQVQTFGAPSFATAQQLFSSFLAEPRTYGITLRGKF